MQHLLLSALALLALCSTPRAQPPSQPLEPSDSTPWHLALEATTDAPIHVGGRIQAEGPHGLRLSASIGILPEAYVDAINATVVAAGGYGDDTADLIAQTLESSLVVRLHAGWRPFAERGFYVDAGYGVVGLGGSTSTEALIAGLTGAEARPDSDDKPYDVSSTLHMIDIELGWQWNPVDPLVLRAALGFAGTIAASTTVEAAFEPRSPRFVDEFERVTADYLDETYTDYVFTPTLGFSAGYRFF